MNRITRAPFALLAAVVAVVLLFQQPAHGKTRVLKVFITGPGITQPVEVADRALVNHWASLIGLHPDQAIVRPQTPLDSPPPVIGQGYVLTRHMSEFGSDFRLVDRVRFYPQARDGRSYTYYIGMDRSRGVSPYDGKWFKPTSDAAARIQRMLKQIGVKS